jgi:uncharacterized peroxidase-related enzyme
MGTVPQTGLEYLEEDEAEGQVAEIYEDVRRTLQMPFVPNAVKTMSASPAVLAGYWAMYKTYVTRISLPPSLISMVLYTVATSNDCTYCASWNELSCRTYGIDDETLHAMVQDLPHLTPDRLRDIIQFALKVVHNAQGIDKADYDRLRDDGMTDEEIMELIMVAAVGQLHDILADTLKIDVDSMVTEGLAHAGRS